jgi:hypothetical protein
MIHVTKMQYKNNNYFPNAFNLTSHALNAQLIMEGELIFYQQI